MTAKAVRHDLVTVFSDLIQRPFITAKLTKPITHTIALVSHYIIKHPRWIVTPSGFKLTQPNALVSASDWVIVTRYLNLCPFIQIRACGDFAAELRRINLKPNNYRVWIVKLGVDRLNIADPVRGIAGFISRAVWGIAMHTDVKWRVWQISKRHVLMIS